jgi:hypothetical protein
MLQVVCASLQTKTGTIVYDKNIVGPGFEEEHQHEEADTLIRVLVADSEYPGRQIYVSSPDTDVFYFVTILSSNWKTDETQLKFLTVNEKKFRKVDFVERVHSWTKTVPSFS